MFYNSKKLIEEKVLQQYYFERFMLADAKGRRGLLPTRYRDTYSLSDNVKCLHPEVSIGKTSKGTNHKTDFVLYPMPSKGLDNLNIEIKWSKKDFENQDERFEYYDGKKGKGFVVALKEREHEHYIINPKDKRETDIPVVYLDVESFKKWFSRYSFDIVSQSLSNKLGIPPQRLTGSKYWVVGIPNSAKDHYFNHGRKSFIWAFKDRKIPRNIMNIMQEDYIVFVYLNYCKPGRMVYPYYKKSRKIKTSRGDIVNSDDINWSIGLLDIFRISKGYHLDFSSKSPYHGFDESWMAKSKQLPQEKEYTQFIRMKYDSDDSFQHLWDKTKSFTLEQKLFPAEDYRLTEFVDSIRKSFNSQGDAIEISRNSFEGLTQLISHF
jgi:hypothetical protein